MLRVVIANVIVLAVTVGAAPLHALEKSAPLNVLLIAVDDLRPELGSYGVSDVKTPHIDRLAGSGVRFDRAYCQFPLCNPSRTSLLTGRHPNSTGVLDNLRWFRAEHPEFVTLPQWFRSKGYFTARTGKIFHGGIDDSDAWVEGGEPRAFEGAERPRTRQNPQQSDRINIVDGDGESLPDFKTADRAIALLQTHQSEPFFLAVGFVKPHSPPTAPRKYFDLYDPQAIALPIDFAPRPTTPDGFPAAAIPQRNGDLFIQRDASVEEAREVIRAYRAATSFVDAQVGRVLSELDRLGLADTTVVVFFGDHGYHLGEKGKWSKHRSLFEVAARVPFILRAPHAKGNGQVSPRVVQLLDIYPTLVALAGQTPAADLQGHNLTPLLDDPHAAWNQAAVTVTNNEGAVGQSIRTERWRYSQWDDGAAGAVLFDHESDPHELKNLAGDPQHAAVVAELKQRLATELSAGAK